MQTGELFFRRLPKKLGEVKKQLPGNFPKGLQEKPKKVIGLKKHPVTGCKSRISSLSITRTAGLLLYTFLSFSCRHTEKIKPVADAEPDGFSEEKSLVIEDEISNSEAIIDRLNDEASWLKLRIRAVEARRVAELTKLSELEFGREMEKYGRLNDRFPGEVGFLKTADRSLWNDQLMEKRAASEKTAAVSRLIERDLNDLTKKLQSKYGDKKIISPFEGN